MVKLTTAIVAFIWLVVTLDLTQAMWPPCNRTKNGKKIYHVFSHYKLSLRSRGGYCKVKVCDEIPKTPKYLRPDWTIKGLSVLQANGEFFQAVFLWKSEVSSNMWAFICSDAFLYQCQSP